MKNIEAKIVWKDIELGFYGLLTSDGKEYLPMNLPEEFQKDGLAVVVQLQEKPDAASMIMWGTPVRITSIKKKG